LAFIREGDREVKYISICSGIEAATTAWHGLGWEPLAFSEIEPFPSAVLAHHYPDVPNLGDMSKYREWPEELLVECDLLVGGTPCQAFSVAGLRKSLDDERGNLSLVYVHLFHHINEVRKRHGRSPAIALWENVPGVLSTKDNAFGCFISGLLGVDETLETEDGKWPKAGFLGSEAVRVGYRILDAQYFAVAQRRRRVFLVAVPCELVASLGERACPSEILSLRESVLGNPPARGEARQAVAGTIAGCSNGGGANGPGRTADDADTLVVSCPPTARTLTQRMHKGFDSTCDSQTPIITGHPDPAYAISAGQQGKGGVFGSGRDSQDTFVVDQNAVSVDLQNVAIGGDVAGTLDTTRPSRGGGQAVAFKPSHYTRGKDGKPDEIAPPLSADADKGDQDTLVMRQSLGFNWQNGGGYGNAKDSLPAAMVPSTKSKRAQSVNDDESWVPGEVAPTQNQFDVGDTRATTVVAYDIHTSVGKKGASEVGIHTALRARTPGQSENSTTTVVAIQERAICENPNAGPDGAGVRQDGVSYTLEARTVPQAVAVDTYNQSIDGDVTQSLRSSSGGGAYDRGVMAAMQVRRLTPTECCRLQGFPDDHCDITFRKKPAADGPKYRALGNSMAVPCMAWLGFRIALATRQDKTGT
jgi:DNA (cytosine-5)-methyltransferase 1